MKTFKLVSMQVVEETKLMDIELDDGLIINKEDENNTWLIEAYVKKDYLDFFQKLYEAEKEVLVQVVITKKENDPATFLSKVSSINTFENHLSILFKGNLAGRKNDFAELLLTDLISKGLSGGELLSTFKEEIRSKFKITSGK